MPVSPAKSVPYTAGSAILQVLDRHRTRGLPSPINAEVLARAGVSESLLPRTLQALQTLDLINEAGEPTPTFEALRKAPESEYKARMAEWLNAAYADVLQFIDPAEADEVAVRDAFRNYNPVGQQARMVSLFMALYAAAGVRDKASQPRAARPATVRPATKPALKLKPIAPKQNLDRHKPVNPAALPPMVATLLGELPPTGGVWTQEQRDRFAAMFNTVLDYSYKIVEENPDEGDAAEAEAP